MIWTILFLFLLIISWPLLSPFEIKVDTRVPVAMIRWISIGSAVLVYEDDEWWFRIQVMGFKKSWRLYKMMAYKRKKSKPIKKIKKQKPSIGLQKFLLLIKTFEVVECKIAIDSGDVVKNAWMYPINFSPYVGKYVSVNFIDENYLVLTIRNAPWRILYVWIK